MFVSFVGLVIGLGVASTLQWWKKNKESEHQEHDDHHQVKFRMFRTSMFTIAFSQVKVLHDPIHAIREQLQDGEYL
jgi:hypothetical protein